MTLTNDGQSGGSVGRLKLERPVWTVPVVVLDVDPQDLLHGRAQRRPFTWSMFRTRRTPTGA